MATVATGRDPPWRRPRQRPIYAVARGESLELEGDLTVTEATATQIKATWPDDPSFGSVWSETTSCEFTFTVDGHAVSYTWHAGD